MMRIILGIDPGYGRTGFGALRITPGKTEAIDYGIITTDAALDFPMRLLDLGRDIDQLLKELAPDLVGIEKLHFAQSTTNALQVAEARGVIQFHCAKHGIPVVEFAPNQIKLAVTGDGHADKKAMAMMVTKILNLKQTPKIDDAADALAVALTASSARVDG